MSRQMFKNYASEEANESWCRVVIVVIVVIVIKYC
jgi:hypothetical protein